MPLMMEPFVHDSNRFRVSAKTLIVVAEPHGYTHAIARAIALRMRTAGHRVDVTDAASGMGRRYRARVSRRRRHGCFRTESGLPRRRTLQPCSERETATAKPPSSEIWTSAADREAVIAAFSRVPMVNGKALF